MSAAAFMKPIEMAKSNMVLNDVCKRMAQVGLLHTEKVASQSVLCMKLEMLLLKIILKIFSMPTVI